MKEILKLEIILKVVDADKTTATTDPVFLWLLDYASVRLNNTLKALEKRNVRTVEDILRIGASGVRTVKGCGWSTVHELKLMLKEKGYELK